MLSGGGVPSAQGPEFTQTPAGREALCFPPGGLSCPKCAPGKKGCPWEQRRVWTCCESQLYRQGPLLQGQLIAERYLQPLGAAIRRKAWHVVVLQKCQGRQVEHPKTCWAKPRLRSRKSSKGAPEKAGSLDISRAAGPAPHVLSGIGQRSAEGGTGGPAAE